VYDDIMENLRVRYVITYKSTTEDRDPKAARAVRIELVDSRTGNPLKIVDTNGRTVHSTVAAEDRYIPKAASAPDLDTSGSRVNPNN